MTTAIVLESSRGDLPLALRIGLIPLMLSLRNMVVSTRVLLTSKPTWRDI